MDVSSILLAGSAYFAELLVELFAGNVEFSVPDGGVAFWVKF